MVKTKNMDMDMKQLCCLHSCDSASADQEYRICGRICFSARHEVAHGRGISN